LEGKLKATAATERRRDAIRAQKVLADGERELVSAHERADAYAEADAERARWRNSPTGTKSTSVLVSAASVLTKGLGKGLGKGPNTTTLMPSASPSSVRSLLSGAAVAGGAKKNAMEVSI
jgi:hypothetical protein